MTADTRESRGGLRHGAAATAAFVLAAAVLLAGLGSHSLWTPDEPTGAAVGRAMFENGDYFVPQLNGRPFLEKPPLYWWTQVAAFRALGVSDPVARVPSAIFAWLTLVVTYALGRRLAGPRAGVIAMAVLATTAEFNEQMTRVVVDPALVLWVSLCHLGFVLLVSPRSARERRWASVLIAVALPFAFLSKGVVAIGLGAAVPVIAFALIARDRRANLLPVVGALAAIAPVLFTLIVAPWAYGMYRDAGWAALRECLVGNTLGRMFSTASSAAYGHRQPIWYYLTSGPVALLPWIVVVPSMIRSGWWRQADPARRLLMSSCAVGVIVLSLAASKRTLYLLPLLPAFAACVSSWAAEIDLRRASGRPGWDQITLTVLALIASAVPIAAFAAVLIVRTHAWSPSSPWAMARVAAAITPSVVWMTGAAAGAALVWIGMGLMRRRASPGFAVAGVLVAYLAIGLVYETAGKSFIDPEKNLHDLTAAIQRLDASPSAVHAYRASESLQAIVNFDLNRRVESLGGADDVVVLFTSQPDARLVLALDAVAELPAHVRAHLEYLYDETGLKASPYAVAAWTR